MPQISSRGYLRETMVRRYGDRERFMLTFTCSHEKVYCRHAERCVLGNAPTLSLMNAAYGRNTSAAWTVPLLTDVSEFCGCKDKLSDGQLEELAYIITAEYGYLKVTEVMLFCWWFKSGRYGRFYGSVDPFVITAALRDFMRDRSLIIAREESRREAARQKEWKARAVSYEEWRARHEKAGT